MSRNLLFLALLVSMTGCSATRPLWSTIVVTPPKLWFRQLPRGESWQLTAVGVTYPSGALTPLPCAPSPVSPVEQVTIFQGDEHPAPQSPNGPVPSVTTVVPVPLVHVPAPALSTIAHHDYTTSLESVNQPLPSVAPTPIGITPIVQAAVAVTYPSGSLTPLACAPSPVRPVELVACYAEEARSAPQSPIGPVRSMTTVVPVLPVNVPAPAVRVESPHPTESDLKPATRISLVSPAQTSTAIRCDQYETTLPGECYVMPVEHLSPPLLVQSDLSELLTEIRNQRQLIEALQRDLTRERSADDTAIEELEAAVENLLVHTQIAQPEMPTTLRK